MPAMDYYPLIHLPNTSECSNWTLLYQRELQPYGDIDGWGVSNDIDSHVFKLGTDK